MHLLSIVLHPFMLPLPLDMSFFAGLGSGKNPKNRCNLFLEHAVVKHFKESHICTGACRNYQYQELPDVMEEYLELGHVEAVPFADWKKNT